MSEFSAIVTAVKPSKRTAQYKVLAALYFLGAATKPVTTKEITDLLKLHFGKKVPANVTAKLRKYSAYVTVVKGPPLRWGLSAKGLEKLRGLSSLPLPTQGEEEREYLTDVAVVCALE